MKTGSFFTALVIVLLVAFLPGARAEDRPLARQGVLDLRGWDFKARGLVKLDGEWEFIWNRLVPPRENDPGAGPRDWPGYIRVPRIWNGQTTAGQKLGGKGVGTYGLTIRLPQQNSIYALFIQEAGSAYDLYLDGRLLARVGFPGETKETSRPAYKPMLVKFHPRGEETRLTILVSNFHQNMGGLWEPLLLGLEEQLADHRMIKTGLDFFLFGAILIMGLYHLGLFLLRKTEPAALYFSGFCLLMSLRVLVTGERHLLELVPGLPWSVLLKLEFLTFYLGGGALAGFIHHLYRDEFKKTVQVLIQAVSLFSSAVVILFPATVYTPLAPLSRALTPAILLYFLGVLVLAAKRKRPGAGTLLLGFLIFLASMVNDLLYAGQMIKTLYLFHFGMAGLVLAQAHVLTQKFVSAFSLVEQQHRDLELSNKALRDSRRKFQNLAELLPGAVFETDREGLVSFANRAATEMFGLKRPVRSREFNVLEAVPESGRAALENQLARLRETRKQDGAGIHRAQGRRLGVSGHGRAGAHPGRGRPDGRDQGGGPGRDPAQRAGSPPQTGREDGGHGHPGRRHRPRLQQHPGRYNRLLRTDAPGHARGRSAEVGPGGHLPGRHQGQGAGQADPQLQPQDRIGDEAGEPGAGGPGEPAPAPGHHPHHGGDQVPHPGEDPHRQGRPHPDPAADP